MAIDQTVVAVNLMQRTITEVTKIHECLAELNQIKEEIASNGVTLSSFTTEIEASDALKHCDAATYTNVISTFIPQIKIALQAFYSGNPTQQGWTALMKILA